MKPQNNQLPPAMHALLETGWSLLSAALVVGISTANQYLAHQGSIDVKLTLTYASIAFLFALVHGIIKLARVSSDPSLVALGTVAEQAVSEVEQKVMPANSTTSAPPAVAVTTPAPAVQSAPAVNMDEIIKNLQAIVAQQQPPQA